MTQTALITGGTGLLGRDVVKEFKRRGWNVVGTGLSRADPPSIVKLDLLNSEEIENTLDDVKPDVVVHCAANRSPDSCTSNPDLARSLNATSTSHIARLCHARSILLLYISTDYVFSGRKGEAPYKPDSATSPPNVYGATKLEGEQEVLKEAPAAEGRGLGVVLRVPVLYGSVSGDDDPSVGAVNVLVPAVWKAQEQTVKTDHYAVRYPTATEDVARVCFDVSTLYLQKLEEGKAKELPTILQFSAEQKMTKYEMCEVLGEILGLPTDGLERHDPSLKDKEGQGTARPYDCHLDTGVLKELGISLQTVDFAAWWRRELRATR
ncbi:NAD(P)-binding protein [Aulographum hederae CBS 113979]|uniref:NAD(P)-binding protein n=1 Tax=Aulographum hederae CBS 113979 TaxID=1176131 RepID=A0A6G1H0M4_9PEZI|nr:NAD(P)-binding protein [Aulographum hederae CBS 113979]